MHVFIQIILVLIIQFCFQSCARKVEVVEKKIPWSNEHSIKMNSDLVVKEKMYIEMYLDHRPHLSLVQTGTGLYYQVFNQTKGQRAKEGLHAGVKYKIGLLDGAKCYATDTSEVDFFKIDKSDVESGVNEGIKMMCVGEKALFIIPSHLAHGISGDSYRIPPMAPLVVEIELISLK